MPIINDFFLLLWGEKNDGFILKNDLSQDDLEMFCDKASIAFSFNSNNIEKLAKISVLPAIFEQKIDKNAIQQIQFDALSILIEKGSNALKLGVLKRLERLRVEGIISYNEKRQIEGIVNLIEAKKVEIKKVELKVAQKGENHYKTAVNSLFTAIENLKEGVELPNLLEKLTQVNTRLNEQSFSIGITGVMNAGKSTMLNALLGKELLGTSVVPETANLTVIRYAKEPYAKVHFWSEKEWLSIEESAKSLKSLDAFIKESKEAFGSDFSSYITKDGRSEQIKTSDLAFYTSAKMSEKKCNLVKSVELFTDLKFVKDGVLIVDTPGLDDPVVQREEITLSYLDECDLMIHLMNAAQAATQKDVDFIIDALLYRNIAQLLVVITRIDAISQKELDEVISYTKRSIEARLKEQNKASKLDEIIAKIRFIPIAGKLALMHKMGQGEEALKMGFDMERTGILHIEAYLEEVLFGEDSQKANLIIKSNKSEILEIANRQSESFKNELKWLGSSMEELELAYKNHLVKKAEVLAFEEKLKASIELCKNELENSFLTLQSFVEKQLIRLQGVVVRRISDDVTYSFEKQKIAPKEERISVMIQTAMKDGLVDLIRDYRYEFSKKMQTLLESLEHQYADFKGILESEAFDVKAFCDEHLGSLLVFKNSTILSKNVNEVIKKHGKSEKGVMLSSLDLLFKAEILSLEEMFKAKLLGVNEKLLEAFLKQVNEPLKKVTQKSKEDGEVLEKALEQMAKNTLNKEQREAEILSKMEVVEAVIGGVR